MCPPFCYMSTLEQPAAETIVHLKRIFNGSLFSMKQKRALLKLRLSLLVCNISDCLQPWFN